MPKKRKPTGFAERLRFLRDQRGWSQEELATKVGLHTMTISKLERGVNLPGWDMALDLADALGVSLDDFRPTKKGRGNK